MDFVGWGDDGLEAPQHAVRLHADTIAGSQSFAIEMDVAFDDMHPDLALVADPVLQERAGPHQTPPHLFAEP